MKKKDAKKKVDVWGWLKGKKDEKPAEEHECCGGGGCCCEDDNEDHKCGCC